MKTKYNLKNETTERHIMPDVDTFETANEYLVIADMPGVDKDNLEILVNDDSLTIKGKVDATPEERLTYQEFKPYTYLRSFKIGNGIDREKINAKIDNGVLTLTLPKSEKIKLRKIEVESDT